MYLQYNCQQQHGKFYVVFCNNFCRLYQLSKSCLLAFNAKVVSWQLQCKCSHFVHCNLFNLWEILEVVMKRGRVKGQEADMGATLHFSELCGNLAEFVKKEDIQVKSLQNMQKIKTMCYWTRQPPKCMEFKVLKCSSQLKFEQCSSMVIHADETHRSQI